MDASAGTAGNRLYYLATVPALFASSSAASARRSEHRGHRRVSPGSSSRSPSAPTSTARAASADLHAHFDEDQIFRIDHYMGKETVQNVLALRFANAIFEPIWNRRYVDHVQVTVAESLGVEHRGDFYEHAGALRDIVQNHVMQVLALTLMEPPDPMDATASATRR